jgi:hypothetical protein
MPRKKPVASTGFGNVFLGVYIIKNPLSNIGFIHFSLSHTDTTFPSEFFIFIVSVGLLWQAKQVPSGL